MSVEYYFHVWNILSIEGYFIKALFTFHFIDINIISLETLNLKCL